MTKQQALDHLTERRRFFLDRQLFGRAETMKHLRDIVEQKDEKEDFSHIKTAGLHIDSQEVTGQVTSSNE